jgi:hypothetical protein
MFARLALLEAYSPLTPEQVEAMSEPQRQSIETMNTNPFNSYSPPSGMSVSWLWNIPASLKSKYESEILPSSKLVLGFFTATELRLSDLETSYNDGDILKELQNNRCFQYLETIPPASWSSIVPFDTSVTSLYATPIQNPFVTSDMINDPAITKKRWFTFVAEDIYQNISKMRTDKDMKALPDPGTLRLDIDKQMRVIDGEKEYSFKMEFIELADPVRAESET